MEHQRFIEACETGDIQTLQLLDYSQINIHAGHEKAFRHACFGGHLDVVKYLISLESDHGQINIHAGDEDAFCNAIWYVGKQPDITMLLLSLEPTHGSINIHVCKEWLFRYVCGRGSMDGIKFLLRLEETHGHIDIHACDEGAFQLACKNGHIDIVKFLLSLEPERGYINIHADSEFAFCFACYNGHLDIVKSLLTLEPSHGLINSHVDNDFAFRNSNFHIKHILIRHDPKYNWKKVYGYKEYREELDQIIDNLTTLHQKMIQFRTDILELNVIGIVKEFLLG